MTENLLTPPLPMPNGLFLEGWIAGRFDGGLLANERPLVEDRLGELQHNLEDLAAQKRTVSEQSGDDWHDGAFRATDSAAAALGERYQSLREAQKWPVVSPPELTEQRVSLGSTVEVRIGNAASFFCSVVGLKLLYEDNTRTEYATLRSALGKAIVGQTAGSVIRAQIGGTSRQIKILDIAPLNNGISGKTQT